jgi:hypothetical protein
MKDGVGPEVVPGSKPYKLPDGRWSWMESTINVRIWTDVNEVHCLRAVWCTFYQQITSAS